MANIRRLLASDDPSIRYKVHSKILRYDTDDPELGRLREEIRVSRRARSLLSMRTMDGRIPYHPYSKWIGAHWVLASLADLDYPGGDESLIPLREQVYEWLLSKEHEGHVQPHHNPFIAPIKRVRNLPRIHASMEGNALYSIITLDLYNNRADKLADRLVQTQWPDGGWNCDSDPKATNSSFTESLIPLRGLNAHVKATGSRASREAVSRAAELFLSRHLFKRKRDGRILKQDFVQLHYPCYWHYDILFALKVMAEAKLVTDERCSEALELLESKRLPDGGFPAEARYYQVSARKTSRNSTVDWGGTSKKRLNEFVTADALYVLREAKRLAVGGVEFA